MYLLKTLFIQNTANLIIFLLQTFCLHFKINKIVLPLSPKF